MRPDSHHTATTPAASFAALVDTLTVAASVPRLRVLSILADGPRHVTELRGLTGTTQPAQSYHLHLMALAGLVESDRRKFTYYTLTTRGRALYAALAPFLATGEDAP